MNVTSDKPTLMSLNEENDISTVFRQFIENRWLILLITSVVFAVGVLYALRQGPQYKADVLLQIDSNQSTMGQNGFFAQQLQMNGLSNNTASIQIALIRSPFILEPVIRALGLNIMALPKLSIWQRLFLLKRHALDVDVFDVPQNKINQALELVFDKPNHIRLYDKNRNLLLQGETKTLLTTADKRIRLRVMTENQPIDTLFTLTKLSNSAVVNSLIMKLNIMEVVGKNAQGTGILSIALTGENPDSIIRTLNAIAAETQKKDAEKKAQEASQTLAFLYQQLPLTKGALETAEANLNHYRSKSGKIDIKLQTQFLLNRLTKLDEKLSNLRIRKLDILQRYTADHPTMMALKLESKALKYERNQLEHQLKKLPASDQIAVNLMRDVRVRKSLYLLLLNKIQEFEVIKAGTVSGVHVLSLAKRPDAPLPDKQVVIYTGSILCGLVFSFMIILGRKLFDSRIDDPRWTEHNLNVANLAIIPYCKQQALNSGYFDKKNINLLPLLAHVAPRNLSIESLRSLRTSLQIALTCANNRIVSILGISPGVGKSFVSVNLAYLLAAGGKRVLLIDGDLRRGTLHKYINQTPSPGLADILSSQCTHEQAIVSTMNDNLYFLPRGAYPSDPSELLMSERLKGLMDTISSLYDIVVIDTAPILLVTDAVVISTISATNYLVMGANAHQPNEIEVALKRLANAGVQVKGTVFNFYRTELLSGAYGKYGKYSRYGKYNTYYYDESLKT